MKHFVTEEDLRRVIVFIKALDSKAAIEECERLIEEVNGVEEDALRERWSQVRKRDKSKEIVVGTAR